MDDPGDRKTYEVIRTDLADGKSFVHRTVTCGQRGMNAMQEWCKRLNAFNIREDFTNHYTVRVKPIPEPEINMDEVMAQ